jgi:hypothetical protein
MKRMTAALAIIAATSSASADDDPDPDLPVVTGKVADDAPGDVRLTLTRQIAFVQGGWTSAKHRRELTVHPGGTFRFAGLPPCPYELVVQGDGVERETRDLVVYADVAGVEIHAKRATPPLPATVAGKIALGFDGTTRDCTVSVAVGGAHAEAFPDSKGAFALENLRAGRGWLTFTYRKDRDRLSFGEPRTSYRRQVPCELRGGENRMDLRLEPDEDVRLVVHSPAPGGPIDGFLTDLAPKSEEPWREQIRVIDGGEGRRSAFRWVTSGIDDCMFQVVGSDFALAGMPRGPHKIRVEAVGFETLERAFDVAGPTNVDVELKALPGVYVQPKIDGPFWFVEERGADGAWTPAFKWDERFMPSGRQAPPAPWIFLAPGAHALRAVKPDAPPSEIVEIKAGPERSRRAVEFEFARGARLRGTLVTARSEKDGSIFSGFEIHVFRLVDKRWEPLRAQQSLADDAFNVAGLAPGRYRLAFDADGKHVFAEFDMGADDVERAFTYRAR